MKNVVRYGNINIELKHKKKGVIEMAKVEIVKKTKNGKNIENVEIEKMDTLQTIQVAKGISELVKVVNGNDKLQNVFKTFNQVRSDVAKEAEQYYAEQKKKGVKPEEVQEYPVGEEAMTRTGAIVWSDLVDVASELLYDAPEKVVSLLANASAIEYDDLKKQELETTIDVFDAVVDANDLQALVNRIKKSKGTLDKIKVVFKGQSNKTEQTQQ